MPTQPSPSRVTAAVAGLALLALVCGWIASPSATPVAAADGPPPVTAAPVEPDMHEFMEYVFQPTFKRLAVHMAAAPADNAGWKAIKADALILAESGNLLLIRPADEHPADWARHSAEVRDFGGQLYRAAKAKDFSAARSPYEAMVKSCNACHTQFAGGEHQLKP